jgi:hypothetical protein
MSASTNTGGGGAGGFTKATTETTTGDAETLLQETPLPDADGVYNIIGRTGVVKKDAADEFAAIKRFEKSVRKAGGSIQQIVDHSDSESFQDLVGGLFSDGDLTLKNGPEGFGLYGGSPVLFSSSQVSLENTKDVSSVTNISNTTLGRIAIAADDSGQIHLIYYDGSSVIYLAPDGAEETISTSTDTQDRNTYELKVDDSGNLHAVWRRDDGALLYSKRSGGTWSSEEVVSSLEVGTAHLDLDENDIPYVGFHDLGNVNVVIADRSSGSWSEQNVFTQELVSGVMGFDVESSTEIGFLFQSQNGGESTYLTTGHLGNFSNLRISTDLFIEEAGDIVKDGNEWLLAYDSNGTIRVGKGTVSGGVTFTDIATTEESDNIEQILLKVESDYNRICFGGDPNNSEENDVIVYTKEGGSWSRSQNIFSLSGRWASDRTGRFWAITDAGEGGPNAILIDHKSDSKETLQFNTGAEVTNADA